MNGGLMKLKNILYRNFDNLNEVEKQFYEKINARIYIDNILNLEYRSYLNRLRYFAPEIGRLIGIELNYKF